MTPESTEDMRNAMHLMAEYVLRIPTRGNRCKWLKEQLVDLLTINDHVLYYAEKYDNEYPYADVRSEYLAQALKSYDQEV